MNLENIIAGKLIYWAGKIAQQVTDRWSVEGKHEIGVGDIVVNGKSVMVELIAKGDAAFIEEYGSGAFMETSLAQNPYIQDYMHSDRYNWLRAGRQNVFLGRKKGDTVYNPDGTTYQSTGKAEGLDLSNPHFGQEYYESHLPLHTIRTEIEFTWPLILKDISTAITNATAEELKEALSFNIYI